jgi:hypothetical protein
MVMTMLLSYDLSEVSKYTIGLVKTGLKFIVITPGILDY